MSMQPSLIVTGFTAGAIVGSMVTSLIYRRRCRAHYGRIFGPGSSVDEKPDRSDTVGNEVRVLQNELKRITFLHDTIRKNLTDLSGKCILSTGTLASAISDSGSQADNAAIKILEATQQVMTISDLCRELSEKTSLGTQSVSDINTSIADVTKTCYLEGRFAADARKQAEDSRSLLQSLVVSINSIGKVTDLISEIADKTNLLALNAKIEAASAGEAGRGFSVVADEVKQLAQESAAAIQRIDDSITLIRSEMEKAVGAIGGVFDKVREIDTVSQSILTGMEQQSRAVDSFAHTLSSSSSLAESIFSQISVSARALEGVTESVAVVGFSSGIAMRESDSVRIITGEIEKLTMMEPADNSAIIR